MSIDFWFVREKKKMKMRIRRFRSILWFLMGIKSFASTGTPTQRRWREIHIRVDCRLETNRYFSHFEWDCLPFWLAQMYIWIKCSRLYLLSETKNLCPAEALLPNWYRICAALPLSRVRITFENYFYIFNSIISVESFIAADKNKLQFMSRSLEYKWKMEKKMLTVLSHDLVQQIKFWMTFIGYYLDEREREKIK